MPPPSVPDHPSYIHPTQQPSPAGYPQQQWQPPRPPRQPGTGLPPLVMLVGVGIGLGIVFGTANVVYARLGFDGSTPKLQLALGYVLGIVLSAVSAGLWLRQYGSGPGPAPGAAGGPPGATHASTTLVTVIASFGMTYGFLMLVGALITKNP